MSRLLGIETKDGMRSLQQKKGKIHPKKKSLTVWPVVKIIFT